MSVVLEFLVDEAEFALGDVLSGAPDVRLELERVVPLRTDVEPYVWAFGDDLEAFEGAVTDDPRVEDLVALERLGDRGLYRIVWAGEPTDLVRAIEETDATVLEARGDGSWLFRLRFDDHDGLSRFHEACRDRDLPIRVERTYPLTEGTDPDDHLGVSPEQREALVLALERGYFATPSEASLDDLAAELDITRQAVSDRIRRGNEAILRRILRPSVGDADGDSS